MWCLKSISKNWNPTLCQDPRSETEDPSHGYDLDPETWDSNVWTRDLRFRTIIVHGTLDQRPCNLNVKLGTQIPRYFSSVGRKIQDPLSGPK